MKNISYYLNAIKYKFFYSKSRLKEIQELQFWENMLTQYIAWYEGEITELYSTAAPKENEKIKVNNLKDSALLTWLEVHQKRRYLFDLELSDNSFINKKVLDVGSGPFPNCTAFHKAEIYCLDPLMSSYIKAGFPIHYFNNTHFIQAYSEKIPLENNSMDVIVSVNAIDHVADLMKTSLELQRIAKKDILFAMHIHYHKPSTTEPIEINDDIFKNTFSWVPQLTKINESNRKMDHILPYGESYALWKNF